MLGLNGTYIDTTHRDNNESSRRFLGIGSRSEFHVARRLIIYVSTAKRLGFTNVARVALYRICKALGIYNWVLPTPKTFFPLEMRIHSSCDDHCSAPLADRSVVLEAEQLLAGKANYFSVHTHNIGSPPDWFLNPFQMKRHPQTGQHWSEIADSNVEVGDIKTFWEISRFSWALVFARAWRVTGDRTYLSAIQQWIEDWWRRNPPNRGPNWMCGQETAIRMINALLAVSVAGGEERLASGLSPFVEAHCKRIDVTKLYGIAQDNNHGTTEGAGLFLGGTWLAKYAEGHLKDRGHHWAAMGRKLLENRVRRLLLSDGSFSQHSLTYHRLMLDTLSIAEASRRHLGAEPFSKVFYARAGAATRWLGAMIDSDSGDGPNLGANDGAHPYRLDAGAYRDFRPSLQLASLLFIGAPALKAGWWDESAAWLGVHAQDATRPWLNDVSSAVFPDGGYVVMCNGTGARLLLRSPTARFRPAHADALHVDFWWKGKNLLRDGGTYAYAEGGAVAASLASAAGHNVPQFDDHDQMPRLGRFLYGDWVSVIGSPIITKSAEAQSWTGNYTDAWGAQHERTVSLRMDALSVRDQLQGFKRNSVLRWRLAPEDWSRNESGCGSTLARIRVESNVPIRRMSLEPGWESRHYLEKTHVPVLEVEIDQSPAVLTTTVTFS